MESITLYSYWTCQSCIGSMAVPLLQDVASLLWPSVFLIWKMEMTGLPYSFSRNSCSHFLLRRKGCILTIIPPISGLLPGRRHQSQTLTYHPLSTQTLLPFAATGEQGPPHLSTGGNFLKKPRLEPTLDMWGICPTLWPRAQNCM